MKIDRQRLYQNAADLFDLDGNAIMKLSRKAATDACLDATLRGLLIVKIEGGIWRDGVFEARLDAIWNGADPPIDEDNARKNNMNAAQFVRSQDNSYNAFVMTLAPMTGYRHRKMVDRTSVN